MAITVYWACLETEWMRSKTPELVLPKYIKDFNKSDNWVKYCPAIRDELKNTFALRSIYDYQFTLLKDSVSSTFYDQDFFNRHVVVRSMEERSFSFTTNIVSIIVFLNISVWQVIKRSLLVCKVFGAGEITKQWS